MDYIKEYKQQVIIRTLIAVIIPILITIASWYIAENYLSVSSNGALLLASIFGLASGVLSSTILSISSSKPLEDIESIISYASNDARGDTAPNVKLIKLGRELITSQSMRIYDLASNMKNVIHDTETRPVPQKTNSATTAQPIDLQAQIMLNAMITPVLGINPAQIVTIANQTTATYFDKPLQDIIGKPLYDTLKLSFKGDQTFDDWLKEVKTSTVTASRSWERVRHSIDNDRFKQFDMIASFSNGSSSGTETYLNIYDRSDYYNREDQEAGFVALAVHELRTPLTVLRGYIEVFEDELGPTLNPELTEFMHKMHASAQQLTAFVSNILNIARVEENQLSLRLRNESMAGILKSAVTDLQLRAQVHGKHIELSIAKNLPPVAADGVSVHEIINNLVDNAIKYSDNSDKIIVTCLVNSEGLVETSVQDFGIGIPASVMDELFQKFHRSHKSRVQIGGTGLGLYLSKALVKAHGGNIWVRSKEGEGSVFTFTLLPFDRLSNEQVAGEDGIIRGAHGWIKNHSLYRN